MAFAENGEVLASANRGDRLLADIARAKHERWKSQYVPIENAYIDRVLGFDTLASRNAIAGRAVAGTEQGIPGVGGARPYNAGSGKFIQERVMAALARGGARSTAAVAGESAAADRSMAGRTGLVRFGQGLSEQGSRSLGQAVAIRRAGDAARDRSKAAIRDSRQDLVGSAIGTYVGYKLTQPRALEWGAAPATDIIPGATPGMMLNVPY